ncbi:MAG: hypothetical protein V1735_02490 [Nanoarchaeota archaeon]
MVGLEWLIIRASGDYLYVVIDYCGDYFLQVGQEHAGHANIAQSFFELMGESPSAVQVCDEYQRLGILGGGHLRWNARRRHAHYTGGSIFGPHKESPPEQKGRLRHAIESIMQGKGIAYDAQLDEEPLPATLLRQPAHP